MIKKATKEQLIKYLPLLVLCIYVIVIHFCIHLDTNDDLYFASFKNQNIFDILQFRYLTWTSRYLIELVLFSIECYFPHLWKIINMLSLIIIYYSINRIVNGKNSVYIKWAIVLGMILYPFIDLGSAGWGATTINYLWPVAAALVAFIPIINLLKGKKIKYKLLFIEIPVFVFACNNEQCCLLCLGFTIMYIIYLLINKKKIHPLFYIYLALSIASLIFIGTCPGNALRYSSELLNWFPDYNQLSFIQKILLAFNNTFELYFMKCDYLFIAFILILMLYYGEKKDKINFIWSFILFIGCFLIPYYKIYILNNNYYLFFKAKESVLPILYLNSKRYLLESMISIFYFISIMRLLYKINSDSSDSRRFLFPILFLAGFLSRFVVGFSPTLFASGFRTGLFFSILLILLIVFINKRICENTGRKYENISLICLSVLSLCSFLSLIIIDYKLFIV